MATTQTISSTSTFTVVHAQYLASKLAADLRQMQLFYGKPSDKQIQDYISEVVVLLKGGYLATVSYGFRSAGQWVMVIKYDAVTGGVLLSDDRAGRVRYGVNVTGATWYSFLTYSPKFLSLSNAEREEVEALLPFARSSAEEPRIGGAWATDRSYSNGGVSLQRQMYSKN